MVLGGDVVVIDFLKTVVQQKCPGPTVMHFFFFTVGILLLWYCNLSNLSCSLVFHESYKHLTRSAKCCKYYYYRCIETQTVCRCHLFYVKSGKWQTFFFKNNQKKQLFWCIVNTYPLGSKVPPPSQMKWTCCHFQESALLSRLSMVKFLKHIRKDKASSAFCLDSRPAQLLPSELCCYIEPVSDSLTFPLPHALLM